MAQTNLLLKGRKLKFENQKNCSEAAQLDTNKKERSRKKISRKKN